MKATVCAGSFHLLLIDFRGSVWCSGNNEEYQLGLDSAHVERNTFEKIHRLHRIVHVSAGSYSSHLLDSEGVVWNCGRFVNGSTLVAKPSKDQFLPRITSIYSHSLSSLFLDDEGFVWSYGSNVFGELGLGDKVERRDKPVKIENLPFITAVSGGFEHSLFLDIEGDVWTWFKCQWATRIG